MDLRLTCLFLVAGLFLSSAEKPENCEELIKPQPIEPTKLHGTWHFITGFTDLEAFDTVLELTLSSTVNVSESATGPNHIIMEQANNINGTCVGSKVTVAIEDGEAKIEMANVTSTFQLLPTLEGCVVFSVNSTFKNVNKLLESLKVKANEDGQVTVRAIYLMCKETNEIPDLGDFIKQAICSDYHGEPKFIYDPKNGFCTKDEVKQTLKF